MSDEGPDVYEGAPHPRDRERLFGHGEAIASFLEGWRSGRLHHAWLIAGPEGIGKATFAYAAARFLLANPPGCTGSADSLFVDPSTPAARQVAAQSHPDLFVVRRQLAKDGKRYMVEIGVDEARDAIARLSGTAGAGGWRVVVVDCADDLNRSSANALLKLIEEPPPNAVFLIVAHAPGRLLPTIRSRCRLLTLRPLEPETVADVVASLGPPWAHTPRAQVLAAAEAGGGSVRRTLERLEPAFAETQGAMTALLGNLPALAPGPLMALGDAVAGREGEARLAIALRVLDDWLGELVRAQAHRGPRTLAPLAEVWDKVHRAVREAEDYNLDRRTLVITLFHDLSDAVRRFRGMAA